MPCGNWRHGVNLHDIVMTTKPMRIFWCLFICVATLMSLFGLYNRSYRGDVVYTGPSFVNAYNPSMNSNLMLDTGYIQWISKRKELLAGTSPKKVLFFAYMRGGSSIGSAMFRHDPRAVLWYEPLAAFYMAYYGTHSPQIPQKILYNHHTSIRMQFDSDEQQLEANFFNSMYKCQFAMIPIHSWTHGFVSYSISNLFKNLSHCVYSDRYHSLVDHCFAIQDSTTVCPDMESSKSRHCPQILREARRILSHIPQEELPDYSEETLDKSLVDFIKNQSAIPSMMLKHTPNITQHLLCMENLRVTLSSCMEHAEIFCREAEIHAAKVVRMKMEEVEQLLLTIPDLHVVHFVRDPRAIAASRNVKPALRLDKDIVAEMNFLCPRIGEDLAVRRKLRSQFPGAFIQVRYEDLIADPFYTAELIYGFIGKKVPSKWVPFAMSDIVKTAINKSDEHKTKWRSLFTQEQLETANTLCSDVLDELGYKYI